MNPNTILNATNRITKPITCVGFKLNLLEYSSLNLVNPPKPEGIDTPVSFAMFNLDGNSF